MGGGFPLDLLLFGMIAAFLVLRLRGILGRKTGFERPQGEAGPVPVPGMARTAAPVIEGRAEAAPAARPLPDPASPVGQALLGLRAVDRNFDLFRLIVQAFAAGDRVALRALLADDTYRSFEQAIAARETAGETQRSEIRSIEQASIEQAVLTGTQASITVKLVSDQIAETLGRDGRPVAGADAVAEISDLWTFERDLAQADPAWRLAAARSV